MDALPDQKVIAVIDAFRQNLSDVRSPASLHVFAGPTQCFAFRLHAPEAAVLLFTQLADRPDKQVIWVEEARFRDAVDSFPLAWELYRDVPVCRGTGRASLADVMESELTSFFLKLGRLADAGKPEFRDAFASSSVAVLLALQPVEAFDPAPIVSRLRRDARLTSEPQRFFRPAAARDAHFAVLLPDAVIGVRPRRSFRSKLQAEWEDRYGWRLAGPCWSATCENTELSVFSTGIVVADTAQPHAALRAINSVLAALSYLGVGCIPVTDLEIGRLHIGASGEVLSMSGSGLRRASPAAGLRTISAELLQQALELAVFAGGENLSTLLRLRHAAYINFYSADYLQAAVLWWTMIERLIQAVWSSHVAAGDVEAERVERLTRSFELTTEVLIEVLARAGKLPLDRYRVLQHLRKLSDTVIHDGEVPTEGQALEFAGTAKTMLKDYLDRLRLRERAPIARSKAQ